MFKLTERNSTKGLNRISRHSSVNTTSLHHKPTAVCAHYIFCHHSQFLHTIKEILNNNCDFIQLVDKCNCNEGTTDNVDNS